jgi:hypothetical protein
MRKRGPIWGWQFIMANPHSCCLMLLIALALGGCAGGGGDLDIPPADSGWQPEGVNAANIRAMTAHPNGVVAGRDDADAIGAEMTPPVEQLWSGHRKPLPTSSIEGSADSASSQPPSGGGQQPGGS